MNALTVHEALVAAKEFQRVLSYHLDRPCDERVEKARVKLIEALERMKG